VSVEPVDHVYKNEPPPPLAEIVDDPLQRLQDGDITELVVVIGDPEVIVTLNELKQPLASVTIKA
jgi:hypothetical protein